MPSSPPTPIQHSGLVLDLAPRVQINKTVAASPSAAAITTVCSLTIDGNLAVSTGILIVGWGAFTVGASGVSVLLQIRRTDTTGTVIASTGACTFAAGNLGSLTLQGLDTSPTLPGQVYVLCATVASAAAASTFSGVQLTAIPI